MASITVQCPRCKTSVEASKNGSEAIKCRCPKCDALFQVTLGASAPAAPTTAVAAPTAVAVPQRPKASSPSSKKTAAKTEPEPKADAPWYANGASEWVNNAKTEPEPKADAPPVRRGGGGLLVVGGVMLVLAGILSVGCIGLGVWGFVAWGVKTPDVPVVVIPNQEQEERTDDKKPPVDETPVKQKVDKKPDPEEKVDKKPDPEKPDDGKKEVKKSRERRRPDSDQLTGSALAERARIIPFDVVGKRERLQEIRGVQVRGKIKFDQATNVNDLVITWESLNRLKYDEKGTFVGMMILLIRDYGWSIQAGNILAFQGDGLDFYQNFNYGTILSNLLPLMEGGFDVVKGQDRMIRGKNCREVTVKRPGRAPMKLFFDKETDLLFKTDFQGKFLDSSNKFVAFSTFVEFYFSDYQVFDGVKHWKKQEQWRDGKKFSEINLSDVKFFNKTDDSLFVVKGLEARIQQITAEYERADKKKLIERALKQLGPGAGSDFTRLVKGFSQTDPEQHGQLRYVIAGYADLWRVKQAVAFERADVPALVTLLKLEDDPDLQRFALEALQQLGPQADQAVPALVVMARDHRDPRMMGGAVIALKTIGVKSAEVLTTFEKLLDHSDVGIADVAALALMQLGPERLQTSRLLTLMARPDPVRTGASNLLRQKLAAVTRKDLTELREGLKHPTREVRIVFIDAIGSLKEDGRDAAPDLTALVGDPNMEISQHAVLALESMGKLVDLVRDSNDAAILTAGIGALKTRGVKTEEALTAYEKHLKHPDDGVKSAAALALIQLAPGRLQVDRLTDLMLTPNDEVRGAAGKLLRAKLAAVTVKDLPALRQGLKNPVREVRLSFVDAIGSLKADGREAALDLADLLGGADKEVSIQASQALEGMGKAGENAVPALEKTIGNMDKSMAVAATMAMCKIDPANATLRSKGVNLLLEDLDPHVKNLKNLLAQPLNHKSVTTVLAMGEPAVDPLVKYMLTRNSPKTVPQNKQLDAASARYLGYEMLKEFAKQAKTKQDKKLIVALKKNEVTLRVFWEVQEITLANQARKAFGLPPEVLQLYTTVPRSANQAHTTISALRVP